MPESCTNKKQNAETQNQHNADNTAKQSIIPNPMVMGNKRDKTVVKVLF